jgi:hypothetical protein
VENIGKGINLTEEDLGVDMQKKGEKGGWLKRMEKERKNTGQKKNKRKRKK